MNGTEESRETLQQQIEETPAPAVPAATESGPPSPPAPAATGQVPENLRSIVEEIIEEAATREVPSAEEHTRRLTMLGECIRKGMAKSSGKIIRYGPEKDRNGNQPYLYFEAPRVFAIAKEARCDYGVVRIPKTGRGYDHWIEDGTDIFYAEAFATCAMLGSSIGTTGAGVATFVTSEDKFMKGSAKSAGKWGHRRNLMLKAQTQAMRKACVKLLGLDGITEAVLTAVLNAGVTDRAKWVKPTIFPVDF
jgi:hypothetical protein